MGNRDQGRIETNDGASARAIERAVEILSCFTLAKPVRSIAELSKETGLSKSTVHRILTALRSKGCIEQISPLGDYRLGIRLFDLGAVVRQQLIFGERVFPYLDRLMNETGETVMGAILDGKEILYLHVIESFQALRVSLPVGWRRPAWFGSTGRALLAWKSPEELDAYLPPDRLEAYTPRSIVDRAEFVRELEKVRDTGYALDIEQYIDGVVGLAAPVFDYSGQVAGTVVVNLPTTRATPENQTRIVAKLLEIANSASLALRSTTTSTPGVIQYPDGDPI